MAIEVMIGPMTFAWVAAGRAILPPLKPRPVLASPGLDIAVVEDRDEMYLLVDHRECTAGAALVEFWCPLDSGEGQLSGLLTVAESGWPGLAPVYQSLREVVDTLRYGVRL